MRLVVEALEVRLGGHRVLDGVAFSADDGERLGLVGESGSGKSTLARAVTRLARVDRGRVSLGGTDLLALRGADLRRSRRRFQMMFQNPYAILDPCMTVAGHLAETLSVHGGAGGSGGGGEPAARIESLLVRVGLPGRGDALPGELSGGQRRRACLARVLATTPELLIVDEPTTGLDAIARAGVLSVLREAAVPVPVFLLITHDLRDVRALCTRVLVLHDGRIVEDRPAAGFTPGTPGLHPYAASLLDAERRLARASNPPAGSGTP
ncbi:MAG: ABC transporter ATP-binding protein [Deltaproteobacteria bacterium]|nr:ABC transporter ATP-binding protein [Deltaproteobacteria bacterium]